jgi:hypothetical protein
MYFVESEVMSSTAVRWKMSRMTLNLWNQGHTFDLMQWIFTPFSRLGVNNQISFVHG